MSGPISVSAEFSPDETQAKFHGNVTLNTTTLSVFKEPKRRGDESLFIGVCSIPLVQFYVHRRNLTLVRKSRAFLFDNAGASAELISSSAGNGSASRINNPSKWDSLTVRFASSEDCERVAHALAKRSAEELSTPPLPLGSSQIATPDSTSSYHRHNEQPRRHRSSSSRRGADDSRASSTASSHRRHRTHSGEDGAGSRSHTPRHKSRRDDVVTPHSSRAMSADMTNSARSMDSPRSSRRPTHHRSDRDREVIAPGRSATANGHRSARRGLDEAGVSSIASPASARSGGHRRRHSSSSARRQQPRDSEEYYHEESPRSTLSRMAPARTDQEQLLRAFQKVLHHRLHFMQYLHKEMVHQAYLAEEAKVKAVTAITAAATAGSQSPRRGAAATSQAEAARLREIEMRLAEVEELHREAERERDNAVRLRRDYEWKLDDLNSNPVAPSAQSQAMRRTRSRDPSELNSGAPSPRRTSYSYNNADLVPMPSRGGPQNPNMYAMVPGGSGYPGNNALIVHPTAATGPASAGYFEMPPEDIDLGSSIVDHYVYGDEWARIYPSQEVDIRFNALLDICLALKLPRRLVHITGLNVDQPGLRVTAEIRFDPSKTDRETVTRRMNGCPFRFLQRFYEMRDIFDPEGANNNNNKRGGGGALTRGRSHPSSRTGSRRGSRVASRGAGRRPRHNDDSDDDSTDSSSDQYQDDDSYRDDDPRRARRRADNRSAQMQRRIQDELDRQKRALADKAAAEDAYAQKRADYEDAKNRERQAAATADAAHSTSALEASEAADRAEIEVGAARQLQSLLSAFRRKELALNLVTGERQRRRAIADQETLSRAQLNDMMNPSATHALLSQLVEAEALHRTRVKQQEAKARDQYSGIRQQSLKLAYADEIENLMSDEAAERAVIASTAALDLLDMVACMNRDKPSSSAKTPRGVRGMSGTTYAALIREIQDQEKAEREQILKDEARRRGLYRLEELVQAEAVTREAMELAELDGREAIIDSMVRASRENLERRINDREQLQSLLAEEQFYRNAITSDEQDGFEVIAELFASALKDLLAQMNDTSDNLESPRHRRMSSMRVAKPFHYMTFEPEDMDYPPSAVLALEGMLGCAINKNLEVVSISKPLPKVTDDELQFQAGDMILDMAGHSLHSLSHLREVLSNRAMQIQGEAVEEFPDVPEEDLTINPALQKYLEVLCEHHNFLVQVLRGCDIYQIIVKS